MTDDQSPKIGDLLYKFLLMNFKNGFNTNVLHYKKKQNLLIL